MVNQTVPQPPRSWIDTIGEAVRADPTPTPPGAAPPSPITEAMGLLAAAIGAGLPEPESVGICRDGDRIRRIEVETATHADLDAWLTHLGLHAMSQPYFAVRDGQREDREQRLSNAHGSWAGVPVRLNCCEYVDAIQARGGVS